MLRCVKCGQAGTGRFCSVCGGEMAPACAGCGAALPQAARFCSECGKPVPPPEPKPAGFTMGDIGIMRGTIDLSNTTNNTTNIGSQTNISGPVNIHMPTQHRGPTRSELIARARTALNVGNYAAGLNAADDIIKAHPDAAEGYYLRAIALLRRRRPRALALDEAQAIERLLESAIRLNRRAEYVYYLATLRDDYYGANRLRMPTPGPNELLRQAEAAPSDAGELQWLLQHLSAPGCSVIAYLERRCL